MHHLKNKEVNNNLTLEHLPNEDLQYLMRFFMSATQDFQVLNLERTSNSEETSSSEETLGLEETLSSEETIIPEQSITLHHRAYKILFEGGFFANEFIDREFLNDMQAAYTCVFPNITPSSELSFSNCAIADIDGLIAFIKNNDLKTIYINGLQIPGHLDKNELTNWILLAPGNEPPRENQFPDRFKDAYSTFYKRCGVAESQTSTEQEELDVNEVNLDYRPS